MKRVWSDGGYGARLSAGIVVAFTGSLFAAALLGWAMTFAERLGAPPGMASGYRSWLASGGWFKLPMWGSALATLATLPRAVTWPQRVMSAAMLFEFGVMPFLVHTRPVSYFGEAVPVTARAKTRSILKWSYRSPETVRRIVALSRDPDPTVREQAVMALGVNLIVSDAEHATLTRPSRYAASPVRDSLRARLLECLADPIEPVRAQAARALWKAPITFGVVPAAAETLAAILDRANDPNRPERLAWLALDAAAGASNPTLESAAGRFARTTDDLDLARYARLAAQVRP